MVFAYPPFWNVSPFYETIVYFWLFPYGIMYNVPSYRNNVCLFIFLKIVCTKCRGMCTLVLYTSPSVLKLPDADLTARSNGVNKMARFDALSQFECTPFCGISDLCVLFSAGAL